MIATLGWLNEARTFASRWNRATRSWSAVNPSGRILTATSRSSRVSRARYTSPMPPAPMSERTSYGPRREPAVSTISSPPSLPHGQTSAELVGEVQKERDAVVDVVAALRFREGEHGKPLAVRCQRDVKFAPQVVDLSV